MTIIERFFNGVKLPPENGEYLEKKYKIGGGILQIGDIVTVHPALWPDGTQRSQSLEAYEAEIVMDKEDYRGYRHISTVVHGKWGAWINDYLFDRLELKMRIQK